MLHSFVNTPTDSAAEKCEWAGDADYTHARLAMIYECSIDSSNPNPASSAARKQSNGNVCSLSPISLFIIDHAFR